MIVSMDNLSYNQVLCASMIEELSKMNAKKSWRESLWTDTNLLDMCISNWFQEMKPLTDRCLPKLLNHLESITGHQD